MKNYRITVNGNTYDVSVEEVNGAFSPDSPAPAAMPAPAPVAAAAPVPAAAAPAPKTQTSGAKGGISIKSPMPGNIFDIKVSVGDKVSVNQVVIVLEAMKMENEIMAPRDATVSQVAVAQGASVDTGSPLVVLA